MRSILLATLAVLGAAACEEAPLGQVRAAVVINAGDYPSIQAAIDAAASGDTVQVPPGTYAETIVHLKPGITLEGAGPDQTVLRGQIYFAGGRPGVVIRGFRIDCAGFTAVQDGAILIEGGAAIIEGNVIASHRLLGIDFGYHSSGEARGNLVTRCGTGMRTAEANSPVVFANNVVTFSVGAGIKDYDSGMNRTIVHNTLVGNGFGYAPGVGGAGISLMSGSTAHVHNNVAVSNNGGIHLASTAATLDHNLVWGNATAYAGGSASPTDVALDPLFVDAAAGNYRLRPGSPALDVGLNGEATSDFDSVARPQGAGADLGAFELAAPGTERVLVLSEVMANPTDEDRGEFVEIYNAGTAPVELAGLWLGDGDALDSLQAFASGSTAVAPGAYAVVVDPEYLGAYGIPAGVTVVTVSTTTIGNGLSTSDPVTLYADAGRTTLATYSHPFDPGNGVSAERLDVAGLDTATNWRASPCTSSAGRSNCASMTLAAGLIISEVMSNPLVEARGEFIELYNGTAAPIDVAGMVISDGDGTDAIIGRGGGPTVVAPTSYAVVLDPDWLPAEIAMQVDPAALLLTVGDSALGTGLAVNDPVTLLGSSGGVLDTYSRTLAVADGRSVEKVSLSRGDVAGNWAQSSCSTGSSPGRLNCVSSASTGPRKPLVITEVMSNPLDEDTGEFVEIYNRGVDPVDAAGLILGDGDSVDVLVGYRAGPTVVPGGGYALILDSEYAGEYTLPPTATLLSTPDTTLGSSLALDDAVRLFESNGVEVIDSYRYPFNPGNGRSAERIDVRAFDTSSNWTASTCTTGSSPGANNCAATASGLPKQVRFTEVMANQLGVETGGAGEFLELLNLGDRSIDLAGMYLECGPPGSPTRDVIIARGGGPTVVPAGAYGVIIDADYDGRYTFPASTVVVTIDDANFGSASLATTHVASLFDADGITLLAGFGYPGDPGDGVSLYRISITGADSAANWAATPCGATPGTSSCPTTVDVTSYTSFWIDRYGDEGGIYWYQAIGWPNWHDPICEMLIVCDGPRSRYRYRDNFAASVPFTFHNPYASYTVLFVERASATDDCGGMAGDCTNASFSVAPGAAATVPASSLGYYFARTDGPSLNVLDWFGGDAMLYWEIPPDGILATFTVEVPLP